MKRPLAKAGIALAVLAAASWLGLRHEQSAGDATSREERLPRGSKSRGRPSARQGADGLPPRQKEIVVAELAVWAEQDPDAAEAWALARVDPEHDQALEILSVAYGRTDPGRSCRVAEKIHDLGRRADALGFGLAQLAVTDSEEVYARLTAARDDRELLARLERSVLPALASVDPERVAIWIAEGRASETSTWAGVAGVVQQWAQTDPESAADWVSQFEDESTAATVVEPFLSVWTSRNATGPVGWINALPAGVTRDLACAAYAKALAATGNPQEALTWAHQVRPGDMAEGILRQLESSIPGNPGND